jgi:zinc transport system ATP-binding protein
MDCKNSNTQCQDTNEFCGSCCTKIKNLSVTLNGTSILENIDLHIHCGQLAVIIGPNGSGKTTLLRAILKEIPSAGSINFQSSDGRSGRNFQIGYVPQHLELDASSPVTVLDLFTASLSKKPLWLGTSPKIRVEATKILEAVNAESLLDKRVGTLSGGQLQRILLALALSPVPDLLLLDEPVSGVDPSGIELFYHMVSDLRKKYHLAIVLVSHDIITTARHADRMLFLNKTIICDDKPQITLMHPAVISTFGKFNIPAIIENPKRDISGQNKLEENS